MFYFQMSLQNLPKCYKPPLVDPWGQQDLWMQNVEFSHDTWCSCSHWLSHLLSIACPLDSKNRSRTIHEIINIGQNCDNLLSLRALPSVPADPWSGPGDAAAGGAADHAGGDAGGGPDETERDAPIPEEELFEILENAEKDENIPG